MNSINSISTNISQLWVSLKWRCLLLRSRASLELESFLLLVGLERITANWTKMKIKIAMERALRREKAEMAELARRQAEQTKATGVQPQLKHPRADDCRGVCFQSLDCHTHYYFYLPEYKGEAFRQLGKDAANPKSSVSWFDAARACEALRNLEAGIEAGEVAAKSDSQ